MTPLVFDTLACPLEDVHAYIFRRFFCSPVVALSFLEGVGPRSDSTVGWRYGRSLFAFPTPLSHFNLTFWP
ncbi:hypothetical protein TSMEX_003170 [Taenia solium]|eukprot:TsM_000412300 transcript=TsM_000412300 gene=TsM_000412300